MRPRFAILTFLILAVSGAAPQSACLTLATS